MTDSEIIMLFLQRDERAICEVDAKYGGLIRKIVHQVLDDYEDVEECLNDVYLSIWDATIHVGPNNLKAYLCKTARNIALDRYRFATREKRAPTRLVEISEEISDMITEDWSTSLVDQLVFDQVLNRFLKSLSPKHRTVFLKRYWLLMTVDEIAMDTGIKLNTVNTILNRTRKQFGQMMEKEGVRL